MAFTFLFTGADFDKTSAKQAIANHEIVFKLKEIYSEMVEIIMTSSESSEDIYRLFMVNELSDKLYKMCDRIEQEIGDDDNWASIEYDQLGLDFWNAWHTSDWMLQAWRAAGSWDINLSFEEELVDVLATLSKQED